MAGGRQNCKRCTRWRPISDFKVRKTKHGEKPEGVCQPCIRAKERERWASRSDADKKRIMKRINTRHAERMADAKQVRAARRELIGSRRGSLVPITPFRMWLIGRLRWYGSVDELRRTQEVPRWLRVRERHALVRSAADPHGAAEDRRQSSYQRGLDEPEPVV